RSAARPWRWSQAGDNGDCQLRPLRRRSSITRTTIAPADATLSLGRARSPTQDPQLVGAWLSQAPNPSRRNPHSARGTGVPHHSRVHSLEAFARRPRCLPHTRHGPASETLHSNGRTENTDRRTACAFPGIGRAPFKAAIVAGHLG